MTHILGLLNFILARGDRWRDKGAEQRAKVAAYLSAVSDCLTRVSAGIREGGVPFSACSELAHYARALPESVERALGVEAGELLHGLQGASSSRRVAIELAEQEEQVRGQLAAIEEAAGKVKAMAVSLAAG